MRSSKSRSRSKTNRPRTLGNIINRVFDSSGPEGKVRGTPQQIIEKYQFLARDAQLSNDRVAAENFQQHAEHYTRLLAEANRELAAEQEARGPQQNNQNTNQNNTQNGQPSGGQYGNQQGGNYGGQQNGNQQNGNQQNGNSRDRQGDNRDYRNEQPRNEQPRTDYRGENRGDNRNDQRSENRGDSRSDNRNDARQDNRSDNRAENRQEARPEQRPEQRHELRPESRPDTRSDFRAETRGDDPQPGLMVGLNDLADPDTGLVATPEAGQPTERAQSRLRQVTEPKVAVEQPVVAAAAPSVDVVDAAPKKTRAPRKPKADAGGGNTGGDGQAAAE